MTKPAKQPAADTAADQQRWIEIFRAGTHTDMHGRKMEFTEEQLEDVASGYDPKVSEAPVVVGHPTTNGPAYGWVGQLKVEDGKLLYAERQSEPQFDALRREGRFKKRSASFFLPTAPNNPTPGKLYLRHVGWLGAAAPAVKGLKDAEFADKGVGVIEFEDEGVSRWNWRTLGSLFSRIRDDIIERDGVEKADRIIPRYEIESLLEAGLTPRNSFKSYEDDSEQTTTVGNDVLPADHADEDSAMTQEKKDDANFAQREEQLTTQATQLEQREKTLREREQKIARDAAVDYADGLVEGGKLLPAQKAPVVELMLAFSGDANTTLSFADGDEKIEKPASEVLREFLDGLPQQIDYSEKAGSKGEGAHNVNFAAPAGTLVDAAQLEIHNKAKAYQQQHPNVSFVDAVKAVGG